MVMQSSGGVMTAADAVARPVFALESGPAAGVVAAVGLAERLGYPNVITFDMGGTTAKASLIENGRVSRSQEYEVVPRSRPGVDCCAAAVSHPHPDDRHRRGRCRGRQPRLARSRRWSTGRPSQCWCPAWPGLLRPRGEEPTVTDANVVLGYIPTGPARLR